MVSALGVGVEENIASIREGRSGVSPYASVLLTGHRLPVAELRLTNEQLHEVAAIPAEAHLSRTALLGILAVREAMEDAGLDSAVRIGLVSSTSVGGMDLTEHFFEDFMQDEAKGRLRDARMHDCAASTEAIVRHCGINAYHTTISTACSSAANAVIVGERLLRHNVVDAVVVGGCDALSAFTLNGFKSLMILDEHPCRPFDQSRAGLNLGEGAGYIVLQREADATKHYCYFKGGTNRNDANHQTASSPEGDGAYLAMKGALETSGVKAEQVSYVNVHGTGTANNDASEGAALRRLFGQSIPPFSSTKAFTGHTLAAAGGIEAVLSVLAVARGYVYPNLNFTTPIEESGLVPQTAFSEGADVQNVLTNSFGFGGNCTSLLFGKANDQSTEAQSGESSHVRTHCYIERVVAADEVRTDIKELIPDAGLRRRMSKVLKSSVATAVECLGGIGHTPLPDAIVTATGWGCLTDSERFLRNIINDREQLLNPTPFIQSTFNTVGGQIALLGHNHCYNVTYANRSHSFEDALLDAMMGCADGRYGHTLLGAFDEQTPSQMRIMERMGLFRRVPCGEGVVFAHLTATPTADSIAEVTYVDFPATSLSEDECRERYCTTRDTMLLYNGYREHGLFPTASAMTFARAVRMIAEGAGEVVVYNEYMGATPTVMVVRCVG